MNWRKRGNLRFCDRESSGSKREIRPIRGSEWQKMSFREKAVTFFHSLKGCATYILDSNKPNLTDFFSNQLAAKQQPAKVLQAVPNEFSSSLNWNMVVDLNRKTSELKEIIPTSLSDAGQLLQLASLVEAKHFKKLLNTNLVWFGISPIRWPWKDSKLQPNV